MKTKATQTDDMRFWRYADLIERRIVTNRTDLARKQKELGFPLPKKFRADKRAMALFPVHEVRAWVMARIAAIEKHKPKQAGRPPA